MHTHAAKGNALSGSLKAQASAGSDHTSSTTGREETSRIRVQGGNISHWYAVALQSAFIFSADITHGCLMLVNLLAAPVSCSLFEN